MGRLNPRDDRAAGDLIEWLGNLGEPIAPALASLVPELRSLLRSDRVLAYAVALEPDGFALDFAYQSGFHVPGDEIHRLLAVGLRRTGGRPWALYDPRLPDPVQRNVVVEMPTPAAMSGHAGNDLFARLRVRGRERHALAARMEALNRGFLRRIGMNDMSVCRVLVCDGPCLLAWVGAARSEPFTERERALVARLAPALVRRLRTERRLASVGFHASALPVLLEAIPAEALLLDAAGAIQHANSAARARSGQEWIELRNQLLRAALAHERCAGAWELSRISSPGLAPHFLAVRKQSPTDAGVRVDAAAARWGLTPRQTEVLALLVHGEPTKNIAARLRCVERTVEAHVTRILANAGADSRAALIAKFWTL